MQIIFIIALISFLAIQIVSGQQEVCARPPEGCELQVKDKICNSWHGCTWTSTASIGRYCENDLLCETKSFAPTKSPTKTKSPTLSKSPTMRPTNRPTEHCAKPSDGCVSQIRYQNCIGWHGCVWFGNPNSFGPYCYDNDACGPQTEAPSFQ